ncbi:MAG: CHASE3 domain-containing protein [Burkholderiales bacterium]|nr:CHASE3 domain-containing protein [Burkholderiales bacterium]
MDFERLTRGLTRLTHLRRGAFALPLAVLATLAVVALNEIGYRHAVDALSGMVDRGDARLHVQSLLRGLADAETAQRGFLLTARASYLEPYASGVRLANESLAELRRLHAGDAVALGQVDAIDRKVREKRSEMVTTLEMHARGRHDLWLELLLSDIGKDKMDEVRKAAAALRAEGEARLGTPAVDDALALARWAVNLMAAVALAAIGALLLSLRRTLAPEDADPAKPEIAHRATELTELAH